MRPLLAFATALTVSVGLAGAANAQRFARSPEQPTRTIIHNPDGTTTIIVTPLHHPRHRSYLDPGTGVSPGDGSRLDYMLPPGGDPGRPDWWYGPDESGGAFYMVRRPFNLPGINPDTPF